MAASCLTALVTVYAVLKLLFGRPSAKPALAEVPNVVAIDGAVGDQPMGAQYSQAKFSGEKCIGDVELPEEDAIQPEVDDNTATTVVEAEEEDIEDSVGDLNTEVDDEAITPAEPTDERPKRYRPMNALGHRIIRVCEDLTGDADRTCLLSREQNEAKWLFMILADIGRYKQDNERVPKLREAARFVENAINKNISKLYAESKTAAEIETGRPSLELSGSNHNVYRVSVELDGGKVKLDSTLNTNAKQSNGEVLDTSTHSIEEVTKEVDAHAQTVDESSRVIQSTSNLKTSPIGESATRKSRCLTFDETMTEPKVQSRSIVELTTSACGVEIYSPPIDNKVSTHEDPARLEANDCVGVQGDLNG